MKITKAEFVKSCPTIKDCPEVTYPEFAVIGRSNVGKSSLINMLTDKKQLAKSSVKPGKTQLINYFNINDARYLVDLPGYGYAKASKTARIDWMDNMYEFLTQRESLDRIFVLIDGKIPPQKLDLEFVGELVDEEIPFDIIITKTDKATQKEVSANVKSFKGELKQRNIPIPEIFLSSSAKGRGKEQILDYIESLIS